MRTKYTYDEEGRITAIDLAAAEESAGPDLKAEYAVFSSGNTKTVMTDANGNLKIQETDAAGNVIMTEDSDASGITISRAALTASAGCTAMMHKAEPLQWNTAKTAKPEVCWNLSSTATMC